MTYELAKELKDAGLEVPYHCVCKWEEDKDIRFPTLEELIDACEEKFQFFTLETNGDIWIASVDNYDHHKQIIEKDKDRLTAVAKLYLKLNKTQ